MNGNLKLRTISVAEGNCMIEEISFGRFYLEYYQVRIGRNIFCLAAYLVGNKENSAAFGNIPDCMHLRCGVCGDSSKSQIKMSSKIS